MSMIRIDLPPDLEKELEQLGVTDEAGRADWLADAIRQKLAAMRQLRYLQSRSARGDREKFREVRAKVPAVEPADDDRWQE
jgi:hypothetical protein